MCALASFLHFCSPEHCVFRAVILPVVLTLAVTQSAALLCRTWCDSQAAAASGCHHEEPASSTSVARDNGCDHVVLDLAAFLREEVRRGVSAPGAAHALLVPRYQLVHSTPDSRLGHDTARPWPLEPRPLRTALRI